MSEQPVQTRTCPTCGNTVPAMARYCPICGTRLDPAAAYTADDFEDALADVLDAPVDEPPVDEPPDEPPASTTLSEHPTESLPPVAATTPSQPTVWTASSSDWAEPSAQAGTWTAPAPVAAQPKPRGKRTMWIILAILGFIIFCCCGSFFALLIVAEGDTAFQEEISHLAVLWTGF